jgi:hypothetical protein
MGEVSLSGSVLGYKCLKRLWYISRGYKGKDIDEGTQRIFDIGRVLEPLAIEWEVRKGREVYYNNRSHGDPADFVLEVGNGVIVGRFDAIFDRKILIDIKTCNLSKFTKLLEGEVLLEWLIQVNVYFFGLKLALCRDDIKELVDGIEKVGIYGVHKESGRTVEVVRDPDLGIFEGVVAKAMKVFGAGFPDELEVDSQECRYCQFSGVFCNF